ncbi:MarR family transcriptional regulator [Natronococcus sp. JC468]|nr:MarR family transcriptional regulator [Natronococcus sp. JC468]
MTVQKVTLRIDPLMHDVLDVFASTDGYATTGYLVDELDSTRPTVGKRLDKLHAAGKIEYVHEPTAFWHLVDDPREE